MTMTMMAPAPSPLHHHHHNSHHAPSPSPSPMPVANKSSSLLSPSKSPAVDFSPPLIAMVVVVAAAFVIVTYSRVIGRHLRPPIQRLLRRFRRRRRFLPSSAGDADSLQYDSTTFDGPHVWSPYGLDESVIKTIPFSLYTANTKYELEDSRRDCAVCLFEFEDDDYVRTLPVCSHTFHVDCIDAWLRSHANCPLCRSGVLCAEYSSPFTPLMASRIRPSFDDHVISILHVDNTPLYTPSHNSLQHEITPCVDENSPRRNTNNGVVSEDRFNGPRDFLLKRSYSFGFERSLPSERMVIEPATASPWRYRRGSTTGFWSKRPSPFGSLGKSRVFSFRYYRGMKSPFFRRRGSFFPLSESSARYAGGGSSSRRCKSMASPMFMRSSAAASSRLRCGDPEALLSPERFNRR